MDHKRPRRRRLSASASRPLELGRRSVPEQAATVQTDLWTRQVRLPRLPQDQLSGLSDCRNWPHGVGYRALSRKRPAACGLAESLEIN